MVVVLMVFVVLASICLLPESANAKNKDRILSKITFIHHKKGRAKPPWAGGGKDKPGDEGIYSYIAKGAKWKAVEELYLNPSCGENLDGSKDDFIADALFAGIDEWQTPDAESLEIFGDLFIDYDVVYNDGALRGYNTITFGSYKNPGVIAITTVWGYFTGPPPGREIIEAHILMNDEFEWGDGSVEASLMDIQNIFTHELGHWVGMGDIYEIAGSEETMYGYSGEGETKKRDLYTGDKAGIIGLYQ
jgi:hypothetical protein